MAGILSLLALLGWILLIAGIGLAITNISQKQSARPGWLMAILGLLLGLGFSVASSGVIEVGATQVAVIYQSVGGNPETNNLWEAPLGPGLHIIPPIITQPFFYSTEVRNYTMSKTVNEGQLSREDAVEARTRDGQQVSIDVSVLYAVDRAAANLIHLRFQDRVENDFVRPTVRSAVREIVSDYSINDLYGGTGSGEATLSQLATVQSRLNEQLTPVFLANGLRLQNLLLREVTFSDQFINAIEAKQVAEQEAERAKQEAERARTVAKGEADAQLLRAKGQADSAIEQSRGEAESIRVRAQAEAEALNLINEQISKNPMLINYRYIELLSDNVQMVLLPSNSPFLFDIQQLMNQTGLSVTK
jgi:prohibitin 2